MRSLGGLWKPSARYSVGALLAIGVAVGGVGVLGTGFALKQTNSLEFCIGCHEMRDTVFMEYKKTVHARNRTGVTATCADCHVPKDVLGLLNAKVKASGDLYATLIGKVDTPEKFEAHRAELAQRVWRRMKASDSQECRNCHSVEAMNARRQSDAAKARHEEGKAQGLTCIECHFAIAHAEPDGPTPQELFSTTSKSQ